MLPEKESFERNVDISATTPETPYGGGGCDINFIKNNF
jgi:hypothetical protein